MWKWVMKHPYIYSIAAVAVVLGVAGYAYVMLKPVTYTTAPVTRGPITQEVTANGAIAAPSTIDLQFQSSGKLTYVGVASGDKVQAGEVLARQDSSVLAAQLQQASAAVDAAQAQLQQLQEGTRPEQIAVTETQLANDQTALTQSRQAVINALQDAYTTADDAVHNKADQFIASPLSNSPQLSFTTTNVQASSALLSDRVVLEALLSQWHSSLASISTSTDMTSVQATSQSDLAHVALFLSNANVVLNSAIATAQASQATINAYVTLIAAARTNVNAAQTALTTAITAAQAAQAAVNKDERTLALEQAGSTPSAIAAQMAAVEQAKANESALRAQLSQLSLRAPVSGTVTAVRGDVGETVPMGTIVISMIPDAKLQIDVNLSEDNVGGVSVGQPARITLDAFPGAEFQGTVTKIDPAQTVIGGAVYYKTTVVLTTPDQRIRSGMTANVWIQTGYATSTLMVPASALTSDAGKSFVQVLQSGKPEKIQVTTGLKSENGDIEVLSGLSEGQLVITEQ
jgi:HlyD family secretion protein